MRKERPITLTINESSRSISTHEGKVWFCPFCGRIDVIKEEEPAICPLCKTPLETRDLVRLKDLSGAFIGKQVLIRATINGESGPKAIPVKFLAHCKICDMTIELNIDSEDFREILPRLFFFKETKIKDYITRLLPRGPCKSERGHKYELNAVGYLDFKFVKLQDHLEFEEE